MIGSIASSSGLVAAGVESSGEVVVVRNGVVKVYPSPRGGIGALAWTESQQLLLGDGSGGISTLSEADEIVLAAETGVSLLIKTLTSLEETRWLLWTGEYGSVGKSMDGTFCGPIQPTPASLETSARFGDTVAVAGKARSTGEHNIEVLLIHP